MNQTAKKVARSGMLVALAFIFSYIEVLIPFSVGIPGVKLGLANLVVLSCIYILSPGEVFFVLIARIFLTGFLFGNMASILYSLAGGVLSFFMMLLLKKTRLFSMVGVSIVGAVFHNVGQILVAIVTVSNAKIALYLPVLLISAVITGALVGITSQSVIKRLKLAVGELGIRQSGKKRDWILGMLLLGIGVFAWLIWQFAPRQTGDSLVVTVDGSVYGTYDLHKDTRVVIADEAGENTIVIADGKAMITEADCPDGICVKHTPIYRQGEVIVCLPHKLVLEIRMESTSGDEVDAVVQ